MLYHSFPIGLYQMSCQTLLFQQKHRQRLVASILKARESLRRLDELESEIRQQIVQTQRTYENLRNYRRNLQENMRKTVGSGGGSKTGTNHDDDDYEGGTPGGWRLINDCKLLRCTIR
uniref:Uncharacterized protein n=1 Tax=Anopheles christyi TaxID=43041 RepID=A0A182JNZ5_9DIPT